MWSLDIVRFLKHFWATVCKTVRPMLSDRCLSCPVCDVAVLWPNGWMNQDKTWHAGRPRPMSIVAKQLDGSKCHFVRSYAAAHATLRYMWNQLPQKGHCPNFRPISIVPKQSSISATQLRYGMC